MRRPEGWDGRDVDTPMPFLLPYVCVKNQITKKIFEYDSYFQNFNRLKALLQLLIFDLFPHHYNKDNNSVLLLISNIFFNINKNKESQIFLKNTYFSSMFNLLIEILCYLCLYNSLKIL